MTDSSLSDARRALLAKRLQKAQHKQPTQPQTITPQPADTPLTLSFAQQRMWFLHQWEPDSPAYNIPNALRLTGNLNVAALETAVNEIIRRHQVLQMSYGIEDEEPVLRRLPNSHVALPIIQMEGADETAVLALLQEEGARPFDLTQELPIRLFLLRLAPDEHVLILNLHHIATDGWSMGVLLRELAALYNAFCANQPSPLPELPIQYSDFAYWQRNWLQGDVLDKQLSYWKQQLAGATAVLELPTDYPRPAMRTLNGAITRFTIPADLTQAIKQSAQQVGLTPFMFMLAAYQILLHRYSGQADILVGSPIANRNRSEIENLIGFFVNTLVLRTNLAHNPRVSEVLQQVRDTTLDAYAHQDLPFEKLVEELHLPRTLSHNPLFQVMFIYQNIPHEPLDLADLAVQPFEEDNGTSKFDLNLVMEEAGDTLLGTLTYNTDLFTADRMARLVGHYQTLLWGMIRQPEKRISQLPLLTPEERRQFTDWMDTAVTRPPFQPLHQRFTEQAAATPSQIAVASEGNEISYQQLNERANRLAHYLQSLGVGPDVRVGLFMERSAETMVALLGILKAGGAYVPIDPLYPPDRVTFMLEDTQVTAVITQADLAQILQPPPGVAVVVLDQDWPTIATYSVANPAVTVAPTNLMYVLFTSGSTGRPKGVAVEHRNYLNYFHSILPQLKIEPGMHLAMTTTFATDLGTIMFWGALCLGGTAHIIPYERATDPDRLAAYCRQYPMDVLKLVPSHLEALMVVPNPADIIPSKLLILTGEASYWETVAKVKAVNPDCVVQDHYGVTETTCATLNYITPAAVPTDQGAALPKGQPLGNVRIHILDEEMQPMPIGIPGRLYIGGAGVTRGYCNHPRLTGERFIPDPFSATPGARLYDTGDLAQYLADGSIKLLGRSDHQVKIRGYRIETGEIESLLTEHPTLQDAVVMAREDTPGDRRLVAYYVPQGEAEVSLSDLRAHLRTQLPDYMVPSLFVPLTAVPLNPNGKVDRFALPVPEQGQVAISEAFVAPRTEREQQLANIWTEVLSLPQVGIDDNFFDVGGESFKAIRVVRKIGPDASVISLFKYPTIRELADHLDSAEPKQEGLLIELTKPIAPADRQLSLVCVPYGGGSAITFQPLADALPAGVALYAVELPGHDFSQRTEALMPLPNLAQQCVAEIEAHVTGPIALYGHCVGSAPVLEIARLLEANGRLVTGVFIGGSLPSAQMPGALFRWWYRLFPSDRWQSNREIYDSLRALGGFTDVIDPDEQEFLLRSLRHDATQAEDFFTHAFQRPPAKLAAPITCIVGEMDRATDLYEERYREWGQFGGRVSLAVLPKAGHYFLKHQSVAVAKIIQEGVTLPTVPVLAETAVSTNGSGHRNGRYIQDVYTATQPETKQAVPSLNLFFLVAFGQVISLIGSGLTSFALGVWVYQQTGSALDLGLVWLFVGLPGLLAAPIAGAVTDRYDRRWVMIASDTAAAVGTLALAALLWSGNLQLWHIYIVVGVGSVAAAFQQPAYIAAIAQIVPKPYLGQANGIAQLGRAAGMLLAPLLGGVLVLMIGLPDIVLIDVLTFLFAVTVLLAVRFPPTLFRKREEPLLQEVVGGWRYVLKRPSLLAMIGFFLVLNFLQSGIRVIITPLILAFDSATLLGSVTSAQGLGLLLGGLAMGIWGGTRRRAEGMIGFTLLFGVSTVIIGLRPTAIFPIVGMLGIGIATAFINAHWQALIQTKVGLELQGRVIATNDMLSWSLMPLGFVLAGALADRVFEPFMGGSSPLATAVGSVIGSGAGRGMGLMIIVIGLLLLFAALLGFRYRPLRYMEDILPDAIPDAVVVKDKDELQALADQQLPETAVS
ncbi:MAG: amino acid adenylation domain-containing protein [Ardenticatenaceae bacterium]|nr:amino acid adenylation domain-containing protein [Ardenticatenaceae bacterium]